MHVFEPFQCGSQESVLGILRCARGDDDKRKSVGDAEMKSLFALLRNELTAELNRAKSKRDDRIVPNKISSVQPSVDTTLPSGRKFTFGGSVAPELGFTKTTPNAVAAVPTPPGKPDEDSRPPRDRDSTVPTLPSDPLRPPLPSDGGPPFRLFDGSSPDSFSSAAGSLTAGVGGVGSNLPQDPNMLVKQLIESLRVNGVY